MKALRILTLAAILTAGTGGDLDAYATPKEKPTQQTQKPTKEERRAEKEKRVAMRATAATQVKVKEGKHPSYNRLLKSTSYALMYTEGLRYYNMRKKGSNNPTMANLRRAQNLFEGALRSQMFNGTPQDDSLYYYYGCSYFMAQDFQTSQDVFDGFRRRFGGSKFIEDAEYKFAMGFYFLSPDSKHDQSITQRAMAAIGEYMGRYPETEHKTTCEERMEELKRKLYAKSYENAKLYYTIGQYKAAVRALNNAIDEYPETPYREELMYLATRSAWLYARNSVPAQMTDRYMAMMDNYYNLVAEFPETRYLKETEQMRDEARKHIETETTEKYGNE